MGTYLEWLTENNRRWFMSNGVTAVRTCWVGVDPQLRSLLLKLPRPDICTRGNECKNIDNDEIPSVICLYGALGDGCTTWPWHWTELKDDLAIFDTRETGLGLKALKNISSGTVITCYAGEIKALPVPVGERNPFIMYFGNGLYVDAETTGNIARFINHSCKLSNTCALRTTFDNNPYIFIKTIRLIKKGEEILFNYGTSYNYFKVCLCKSCHPPVKIADSTLIPNVAVRPTVRVEPQRKEENLEYLGEFYSSPEHNSDDSLFTPIIVRRRKRSRKRNRNSPRTQAAIDTAILASLQTNRSVIDTVQQYLSENTVTETDIYPQQNGNVNHQTTVQDTYKYSPFQVEPVAGPSRLHNAHGLFPHIQSTRKNCTKHRSTKSTKKQRKDQFAGMPNLSVSLDDTIITHQREGSDEISFFDNTPPVIDHFPMKLNNKIPGNGVIYFRKANQLRLPKWLLPQILLTKLPIQKQVSLPIDSNCSKCERPFAELCSSTGHVRCTRDQCALRPHCDHCFCDWIRKDGAPPFTIRLAHWCVVCKHKNGHIGKRYFCPNLVFCHMRDTHKDCYLICCCGVHAN